MTDEPAVTPAAAAPAQRAVVALVAAGFGLIMVIALIPILGGRRRPVLETPAEVAARLGIPERRTFDIIKGVRLETTLIPPGTFSMGDGDESTLIERMMVGVGLRKARLRDAAACPAHEVRITKAFYLGVTEITQRQFETLMLKNPSVFADDPQKPVDTMTFEDCGKFVERLTWVTGEPFRLPTEAEWEHACRAGTTGDWSFGEDARDVEQYAVIFGQSSPVGSKLPNPWGLYDMHGNAWEYCSDWLGSYAPGLQVDPTGPSTGTIRVIRGGSWLNGASSTRSHERWTGDWGETSRDVSFRVAFDAEE